MSRTFRRKNFENTCRKHGHEYYLIPETYVQTGNGHGGYWVMRKPTKQEFDKKYHWMHGESKHNKAWSPNRESYRGPAEVKLRMKNKQELYKYWKNPDQYEPMLDARASSCYRLWAWW